MVHPESFYEVTINKFWRPWKKPTIIFIHDVYDTPNTWCHVMRIMFERTYDLMTYPLMGYDYAYNPERINLED